MGSDGSSSGKELRGMEKRKDEHNIATPILSPTSHNMRRIPKTRRQAAGIRYTDTSNLVKITAQGHLTPWLEVAQSHD